MFAKSQNRYCTGNESILSESGCSLAQTVTGGHLGLGLSGIGSLHGGDCGETGLFAFLGLVLSLSADIKIK